jgi:formylglycine-generating enzyme required for sulfatase activity
MFFTSLFLLFGNSLMFATTQDLMFSPAFYETGTGCIWTRPHSELLSMDEWFLAGPAPGIYRDEWLEAAADYRDQVSQGGKRFLLLDTARGVARVQPSSALTRLLKLQPGDELFYSFRARSGKESVFSLTLEEITHEQGSPDNWQKTLQTLHLPGDGEWHELSWSVNIPEDVPETCIAAPVLTLMPGSDMSASAEIAGILFGIGDTERMSLLGNHLRFMNSTHMCRCIYNRDDLEWAGSAFSGYFLFAYDRRFYTPEEGYKTQALIEDFQERLGGVDTVVFWPSYPQLGVDDRSQFDFFDDMPGGLTGLREQFRLMQEKGIRILLPFLPWDTGTRRENDEAEKQLIALVAALEADGIFMDSLSGAEDRLRMATDSEKLGVVFVPGACPPVEQVSVCNLSWAQNAEYPIPPGIPLLKWVEPRHMQHFVRPFSLDRREEIEQAFFNGSGLMIWENVFGFANPLSEEDAALWKRCVSILRSMHKPFTSSLWDPFFPSLQEDLYIHRWPGAPGTVFTLINKGEPLEYVPLIRWKLPESLRADQMVVYDLWNGGTLRWDMNEFGAVQVWGDVERLGCIAISFSPDENLENLAAQRKKEQLPEASSRHQYLALPPRLAAPAANASSNTGGTDGMRFISGGGITLAAANPGNPADERLLPLQKQAEAETHQVNPFYMDEAQVSNGAFQVFLQETGYHPENDQNFLKHWGGRSMPDALADLPVVYVSLEDARAYAAWAGKRLPTEEEWQAAAQGEDGRCWPWGNDFSSQHCAPAGTAPASVRSCASGRSPYGMYHMTGNVREWTESEYSDGITRFCILRGGSCYEAKGSRRYVPGGPQPVTARTKYLLMHPGLDRSSLIGFRCAKDAVSAG